jgi:hypothetical protein
MEKEKTRYCGGYLPCLHCGELIDMNGKDIHLCKNNSGDWLKKQKEAIMRFPDGTLWDLKNKKIIKG